MIVTHFAYIVLTNLMGWGERVIRIIRSPRATLGALVALDLTLLFDLFSSIPEWLVPAVSVSIGLVGSDIIDIILTLFIIIITFYVFVPKMYPAKSGLPREAPGFRALVTLGSFSIFLIFFSKVRITFANSEAWQITTSIIPAPKSAMSMLLLLIILTELTGAALTVYLINRHNWKLFDPAGHPVQVADQFFLFSDFQKEAVKELPRKDLKGVFNRVIWAIAFVLLIGLPCFFAGLIATVLYLADPLPDLLILSWVAAGMAAPIVQSIRQPRRVDLEVRLYETVRNTTRSLKGLIVTTVAIGGLIPSVAISLFSALGAVPIIIDGIFSGLARVGNAPLLVALQISGGIGSWLSLFGAGVYGIWFWLRVFRRLPAFLAYWEGESAIGDVPTRPPGLTFPPAIVLVSLFWYGNFMIESLGAGASREQYLWIILPLAVGWPLFLGVLVVPVWFTHRLPSQDLAYEDHIVTGSFAIQWLAVWLMFLPSSSVRVSWVLLMVVFIVAASLFPNLYRYSKTPSSLRGRIMLAYIVLFAVLFGLMVHFWGA